MVSRIATRRLVMPTIWSAVVLLAVIGLAASAGRLYSVLKGLRAPTPPELSSLDQWSTRGTAIMIGVRPGTARYREGEAQNRRFLAKFNRYPTATLLHVVPAGLFMILAPLQFSRRIRSRHIRLHRWSGRLLVTLALPLGLSGLFFGLLMPFSGVLEAAAIALFGGIFLFAVVRAFLAIRRKDIATHREWMIRMFSIAIGVSTVRLVGTVFTLVLRDGPEAWFGQSVWIGFALTLGVAELWIRATRGRDVTEGGVALPEGAALPTPHGARHVRT